ncbi:hypothetical protein AB0F18_09310 [Streptomyces sp. NPDC029216]|uniref:hypothetical protein n=1 Tax=Streptomyces sp. NPDC029216 TaxID=3154701 RepID=UPI0033E0E1A0
MRKALRRGGSGALAALACGALLAGCTQKAEVTPGPKPPTGPTATPTAAPPEAAGLAERYRAAGGDPDVYGIQRETGPDGVPRLIVRTRNADEGDAVFRKQHASIASYLTAKEGVPLTGGYLIDVFGPDGRLLHRMDTRP